ncbi:MAG: homoserine O-acetyltransferase [Deltaproteobacteria bacterium]|nr:homoserine O-acetyltransferase [Deltaproteobacteria bacterium]
MDKLARLISPSTLTFRSDEPFNLESGGTLPSIRVAYRTWGRLTPDRDNAVVVCHALTGSADVDEWWPRMLGPGKALDPDSDFILCANILGGCYGSTGPTTIDPATGLPFGPDFPPVTVRDMVRAQRLLLDSLGVTRVRVVLGGSLGGMQTLEWAILCPDLVETIVPIATSSRHSPWCIGLSEAQRQAIMADGDWNEGRYSPGHPPTAGLGAARMMAMCSYRSWPGFQHRFGRRRQEGRADVFQVESYLRYQGLKLNNRFDANTYVALTRAMDSHDVSRGRKDAAGVLNDIHQPALVVTIDSDVLYPTPEQRELADNMPGARLCVLNSPHGHDAFLIEVDELESRVREFRQRCG